MLAAGVPIIATAIEGNLEQINDGVEGLLIPPNDADAMAAGIDKILSNPDLHRRLSQNALIKSKAFEWEHMVDHYESSYARVLSNRQLKKPT